MGLIPSNCVTLSPQLHRAGWAGALRPRFAGHGRVKFGATEGVASPTPSWTVPNHRKKVSQETRSVSEGAAHRQIRGTVGITWVGCEVRRYHTPSQHSKVGLTEDDKEANRRANYELQ